MLSPSSPIDETAWLPQGGSRGTSFAPLMESFAPPMKFDQACTHMPEPTRFGALPGAGGVSGCIMAASWQAGRKLESCATAEDVDKVDARSRCLGVSFGNDRRIPTMIERPEVYYRVLRPFQAQVFEH